MVGKYFIQQYKQLDYLHGGIGPVDAEKILLSKGFQPVYFPHHNNFSIGAKFSRFFFLVKTILSIPKGSIVIFLYPVYATMNKLLLSWLTRKGNIKLICFIADIDGIKDGNNRLLQKEIKFFRQFRYFIVHNDKMKEWVYSNVSVDAIASTIEFFDFMTKPVEKVNNPSFDIAFAGNLEKSTFLEKLGLLTVNNSQMNFHLYGPGQADAMLAQKNVSWHGVEKPYDLPPKLKGSFGLLWDGDSIDGPGGSLGNYMQYISHHKLSLYILSKLPIIVPATAASSPLVAKYKVGFAINNLYEIEDKIKAISIDEYQQMQANMHPLAEKISRGECLGNAIDELIKLL